MSFLAGTVFEVQTGGSDNNGGGFATGASGTDYSQQAAAQYALTTVTTSGINNVCLYSGASADMVGNVLQIISGTNFTPGMYPIQSVVVGVSFTLDRNCTTASGSGGVMNIGGAFASPGKAAQVANISGNLIWVKAGTYTLSTATPGAGGPVVLATNIRIKMEGYTTTRGDRAGRPSVNAGAIPSVNIFAGSSNGTHAFVHMEANGNSQVGVSGFSLTNAAWMALDCYAKNCDQASAAGFSISTGNAVRCGASACTIGFSCTSTGSMQRCWADACGIGFNTTAANTNINLCLATDCTGDGFNGSNSGIVYVGCVAEGNAGDGFDISSTTNRCYLFGCAATNNGGFGYNVSAAPMLDYCASYLNTSGRLATTPLADTNSILLTGDPWVDAASDDYRPNNTTGAGASLRGIANVGIFGQTDNRDVSTIQHGNDGMPRSRLQLGH